MVEDDDDDDDDEKDSTRTTSNDNSRENAITAPNQTRWLSIMVLPVIVSQRNITTFIFFEQLFGFCQASDIRAKADTVTHPIVPKPC